MGHIFFDKPGRKPSYRGFLGNHREREREGVECSYKNLEIENKDNEKNEKPLLDKGYLYRYRKRVIGS